MRCWYLSHMHKSLLQMSSDMRFPTMWYVRPTKPLISLRIRAVWSEPLMLVAWVLYECWATDWATDWTSFGVSKLKSDSRLESTLVEMPHCWKSHVAAQMSMLTYPLNFNPSLHLYPYFVYASIEGFGDTAWMPRLVWPSISIKILCAGPYKYVAYQYHTGLDTKNQYLTVIYVLPKGKGNKPNGTQWHCM